MKIQVQKNKLSTREKAMNSKQPIKILHVVGAMNRGGTETLLMNIYRNIDREQIQFDFISYSQEEAHYDQEIGKMNGRVIKLTKTNSIKQIYGAIKEYGPYDAVHAHTLFHCGIASIAALLAGVKIRVSHAHTTLDKSDNYLRKLYITCMVLVINIFSTNLLACSRGAGLYLFGEKGLVNPKYAYFPNAIDYSQFLTVPQIDVKKLKVEEGLGNCLVIGHIGTFKEAKNHTFILEVMKRLTKKEPTIKLLLVGDGDLRQQIEEESKKEKHFENIKFMGIRNDIATLFYCMDVFIFPSFYEGLGLVLLEAQASGVPCVVSEAIQPEADLGLGLVTKLSLTDGPGIWADNIIGVASKREENTHKIIASFEDNGYSISKGISTLMQIYQANTGGAHEEDTDCVL